MINDLDSMPPYQLRVVAEKAELDIKIDKLLAFLDTEVYEVLDVDEQRRLHIQHHAMCTYSAMLGERIEAFPKV